MKEIKIGFTDFWNGFNLQTDPIFGKLISENFNIVYTNKNPDFLFFSVFGKDHINYNCTKILYTPENFFYHNYPYIRNAKSFDDIWNFADFSITSFRSENEKNFRMPCYIRKFGFEIKDKIEDRIYKKEKKGVLYLQSNCIGFRDNFVKKLMNHIPIDCAGICLSNMNVTVKDKIKFAENYKFLISFENSSLSGYNTEKITDAFISKTIPIYWGDTDIHFDYNNKSILNYHDYQNEDDFIKKILEYDKNEDLFYQTLDINPIHNHYMYDKNNFINFLNNIFYV